MPPLWPVPRAYSHASGLREAAASAAISSDGHLVVEGPTRAGASLSTRRQPQTSHDCPEWCR
eukprot:220853-Prymnesium_polylepis.1